MSDRQIFITANDLKRLEEVIAAEHISHRDRGDLKALVAEMKKARVVDSREVPNTVVTLNSKLRLRDLNDDHEMAVTLVFPSDSNIEHGKLSVMSPIGTAVLGYSEGDTIEWDVPGGRRKIRIEKVLYQPEAAGDFHL